QELSRLVEGHRVSSGALEIESNQRTLIRFGVVEKILYLLCNISLCAPVIGSPKERCIACRFATGRILGVLPGCPCCRLMDDSPNAEVSSLREALHPVSLIDVHNPQIDHGEPFLLIADFLDLSRG